MAVGKQKRHVVSLWMGIGIFVILLFVYFGVAWYVASRLIAANPSRITFTPRIISDNYENVTIHGSDAIELKGWLFRNTGDKLIIFISGHGENRGNDYYLGTLIVKELLAEGYNVLVYDSRAHGESGGEYVTLGVKESKDILKVVDFAKAKGFAVEKIGIVGHSLGAISTLMVIDRLHDIGGIVVDSPASDMKKVVAHILATEQNIPSFVHPATFFIMKSVYGVDLNMVKPIEKIGLAPDRRFLFLHGGQDTSILPINSEALLAKANKTSKLIIFPDGRHIETYKSDPELYRKEVFQFLREAL